MLAVLDPSCVPLFHMTAARERWGSDWSVGLKSPSFLDSAPGATATTTSNVSLSPKHAVKCHLKGTTAGPLSSPQPSELLSRHHETQAGIPCHSAFSQGWTSVWLSEPLGDCWDCHFRKTTVLCFVEGRAAGGEVSTQQLLSLVPMITSYQSGCWILQVKRHISYVLLQSKGWGVYVP